MSSDTLDAGAIIGGKYEIRSPIGRGGFSHVYRGIHRAMERTVAIKIFDPDDHGGDTPDRTAWRAERFEREARVVSQLQHPNTVTIFDYGLDDEQRAYLVMEYIRGPTLDEVIRNEAPLPRDRTISIFLQVLESLEEAHHREILHRDLKPANIMLTTNFKDEEIAKVLDFGIARMLRDPPEQDANSRLFLGTPRYAAPEQLRLRDLTLATDIYCVGTLLWECIIGKPMVPTGDVRQCIRLARRPDPWRMPDEVDVDPDLKAVLEKAVAKDPARRYQNAGQMMDALEGCASIVRSELPDIEPNSPFSGVEGIVDPNVADTGDDTDADNFFLNPDGPASPPPTPYAALRESAPSRLPPSHRDKKKKRRRTSSPPAVADQTSPGADATSSSPTSSPPGPDHDTDSDPRPLAAPTESSLHSSRRPPTRPRSRPETGSDDDGRQIIVFASIAAAMALLGVVAVGGLWLTSTGNGNDDVVEKSTTSSAEPQRDDDVVAHEFEPSPAFGTGLFNIETVVLAAERFDWDVERGHSRKRLADYNYEHMRLVGATGSVDLHVYAFDDPELMAERKIETPVSDIHIILGDVFVRISPHGDDDADAAASAHEHLRQFRDLVLEEAGYH